MSIEVHGHQRRPSSLGEGIVRLRDKDRVKNNESLMEDV